jgi:hypothetical protein
MKKILLYTLFATGIALSILLISSNNVKADTMYCDDHGKENWGFCYYFPESGNWICLNGPANTCGGVHIE